MKICSCHFFVVHLQLQRFYSRYLSAKLDRFRPAQTLKEHPRVASRDNISKKIKAFANACYLSKRNVGSFSL